MTEMNIKGFPKADMAMRSCADLLLAASPEQLAAIQGADRVGAFPGLLTFSGALDEPVPAHLLHAARAIVIEVDPGNAASLDRLRVIGRDYPDLPRIAAIADATVALVQTLVREGVSDVIVLPLHPGELLDAAVVLQDDLRIDTDVGQNVVPPDRHYRSDTAGEITDCP